MSEKFREAYILNPTVRFLFNVAWTIHRYVYKELPQRLLRSVREKKQKHRHNDLLQLDVAG